MLRVYCVENLAVTIEDLYFHDPEPAPGQEGDERGIRVELRLLDPQPWRGTRYAAQRIVVDQAVWRADFLESIAAGPGTKDRMHHHPAMRDNEPGGRTYSEDMTADPMAFLAAQLADPIALLAGAGIPDPDGYAAAAEALREALPEILRTADTTLAAVRAGRLATQPALPS
jgi:hypothetical protein